MSESEDEANVVISIKRYSPDDIEAVAIYQVTRTCALDMRVIRVNYRENCRRKAEEEVRKREEQEYQRLKKKLGK
jgi:cytidylate kinase